MLSWSATWWTKWSVCGHWHVPRLTPTWFSSAWQPHNGRQVTAAQTNSRTAANKANDDHDDSFRRIRIELRHYGDNNFFRRRPEFVASSAQSSTTSPPVWPTSDVWRVTSPTFYRKLSPSRTHEIVHIHCKLINCYGNPHYAMYCNLDPSMTNCVDWSDVVHCYEAIGKTCYESK